MQSILIVMRSRSRHVSPMSRSTWQSTSRPSASEEPPASTSTASLTRSRSSSTTRVWSSRRSSKDLGAPLSIALRPDTKKIVIDYQSAPDASALLWLTPEQTAGKKAPFVFSQGESIYNRTWIPTQDSPAIRQTWEAKVRVDKPLTVVMSGSRSEPEDAGNQRIFSFRMEHSV